MSVYEQKYLKYKNKYNMLKQTGGAGNKLVAYFVREGKLAPILDKIKHLKESKVDDLLHLDGYKIELGGKEM